MGLIDSVKFAFTVMTRWETLATLAAFILMWLLLRTVADPWAKENRPPRAPRVPRAPKQPKGAAPAEEAPVDEDDELPD
jgi:hypothetical protein